MAASQEDLAEVLSGEDSGLTATVAEVFRDMAAVSATARRTSDQLSVTRKLHHVRASMQSSAQLVVEAEVAFLVNAARQQVTEKRSPEFANGQPGSVAFSPPAVPVGLLLQSDRLPTSGPIWTGTPDGLRTSTDIINRCDDVDSTDVKTFDFLLLYLVLLTLLSMLPLLIVLS